MFRGSIVPGLIIIAVTCATIGVCCTVAKHANRPDAVTGVVCQKCRWNTGIEWYQLTFTCRNPQCGLRQRVVEYVPKNIEETPEPTP